jgi:hypothetical protein
MASMNIISVAALRRTMAADQRNKTIRDLVGGGA